MVYKPEMKVLAGFNKCVLRAEVALSVASLGFAVLPGGKSWHGHRGESLARRGLCILSATCSRR